MKLCPFLASQVIGIRLQPFEDMGKLEQWMYCQKELCQLWNGENCSFYRDEKEPHNKE